LIAQYRAALLAEASRRKRYPLVALDNGWEGEVVVRMAIAADGSLAALNVRSSSGHAALDRQALEMFRKARAGVPVPDSLRGRPFSLELRAVFNLKDQASG
jgi:protein TonB